MQWLHQECRPTRGAINAIQGAHAIKCFIPLHVMLMMIYLLTRNCRLRGHSANTAFLRRAPQGFKDM